MKALNLNLSDLLNQYRCVCDGCYTIAVNPNKKPILRKCLSYAKKGHYVELWYTHYNGRSQLLEFWN